MLLSNSRKTLIVVSYIVGEREDMSINVRRWNLYADTSHSSLLYFQRRLHQIRINNVKEEVKTRVSFLINKILLLFKID